MKNCVYYNNCVEIKVNDKVIYFYLPTAENAKILAMLTRRCCDMQEFEIDVKYRTPEGFLSAYQEGSHKVRVPFGVWKGIIELKEERAKFRLILQIKDTQLEFYLYSFEDLCALYDLMRLGLSRTEYVLKLLRNNKAVSAWQEMNRDYFLKLRLARLLTEVPQQDVGTVMSSLNSEEALKEYLEMI